MVLNSCYTIISLRAAATAKLFSQQTRCMSKYLSKAATKRRPLTAKRAGKGFYKGKGCTKEGSFTGKAGRFVLDRSRMLELVVPDLTGFKVGDF